jgi:hypothetical protein
MTKLIVAFRNFANVLKSNSLFVENMCHISVQDGGKHAEVMVNAANSDHRQTCSCAVGNGTSRDGDAAAAVTLSVSRHYLRIYVYYVSM